MAKALEAGLMGIQAGMLHANNKRKNEAQDRLQGMRGRVEQQIDDGTFNMNSKEYQKLMLQDPNAAAASKVFAGLDENRKKDFFQAASRVQTFMKNKDKDGALKFLDGRIANIEKYNSTGQNAPADPSMSVDIRNRLVTESDDQINAGLESIYQAGVAGEYLKPRKKEVAPTAFEEMQAVYKTGDPNQIDMYNKKFKLGKYSTGTDGGKKFEHAAKMRTEVKAASSEFNKIQTAYDRIKSIEPTAAGDLALIFNFMKMLDPGSTVREGEFATAAGAASVPERMKGAYNRVISGERLTEKQRADFLKQTENLYGASGKRHNKKMSGFIKVGARFGLEAEDIIANPLNTDPLGLFK